MLAAGDDTQREILMQFFKTGEGDYGYGDKFLGLKNPQTRSFVKKYQDLNMEEIQTLVDSEYHEVRLCGFLILVEKYQKLQSVKLLHDINSMAERDAIANFYVANSTRANNWDIVDLTAPKIIGSWIVDRTLVSLPDKEDVIQSLAESDNLWQKRISMVFTWMTSRHNMPEYALKYAKFHLKHPHDLMHKAVGWMLRELGKCCGMEILRDFLADHRNQMHRTTLRYAIEKMDEKERRYWMN
ncbi:MAG: DNA alkylation repair protein [Bacteroidales bacterium]|nr:DNA alkylation repair protein [Bacteroidales bacterium]